MIPYEQFGKLRLKDFTFDADEIERVRDWEFMDQIWLGEKLNFTEFLRLKTDPKVVRSIAIDFSGFLMEEQTRLLETLGLPLRQCMTLEELTRTLGKPTNCQVYPSAQDRTTYEYRLAGPPPTISPAQ